MTEKVRYIQRHDPDIPTKCFSALPKAEDARYGEYVEALKRIFAKYSKNSAVPYPYVTRCYIGKA